MKCFLRVSTGILLSLLTGWGATSHAQVTGLTATSDSTSAYYSFSYPGAPSFLRLFLDTDRNSATGYPIKGLGAEFMIENSVIYKYTGSGGSWAWSSAGSSNMVKAAPKVSWTIARSQLGAVSSLNVMGNYDNTYYSAIQTQTLASATTWTFCANENSTCSYSGSKIVRYGANGVFVTKTLTGPVACNNSTFGDPIYGVAKHCDLSSQVVAQPTPTPTPAPSPTPTPTPAPSPTPTATPTPTPTPSSIGFDTSGPVKIAYHGDSTVLGYSLAAPPPLVADNNLPSNFYVRNEGVGGSTFKKLLDGTDTVHPPWSIWIAQSTDQVVIANQAINDVNSLVNDVETYKSYARQVVDIARAGGKFMILETPNPTIVGAMIKTYADAMKQVALEKNVPVIDQYTYLTQYMSANNLTVNSLTYDGVHPNQTGANLKGQYAAYRIKQILGLSASPSPTPTPTPAPSPSPTPTPTPTAGPVYYVSPSGNDLNAGSSSAPWRTIQKAANTVSAGATVVLMNGTYEEPSINVSRSGTATAPITYKAQNKGMAILASTSGCNPGFSISASYITLQDLRLTVSSRNVNCTTYTSANVHVRAWNSVVATPSNPTTGYVGFVARGLKVDASAARSEGLKSNQDFTIIENSEIGSSVELYSSKNSFVRNNVITGQSGSGLSIFGKGGLRNAQIYGNIIHVKSANASGVLIGGNSCSTCHFDDSTGIEAYNTVAYNNVVINESSGTIVGLQFSGAVDSAFFNNVVINGVIAMAVGGQSGGVRAPTTNPTFKNNIVVCSGAPLTTFYYGWTYSGSLNADYNDFYNCSGALSQAHAIVGNPLFVNQLSDWHLQAGSPAINSGIAVSMPAYGGGLLDVSRDFNGISRSTPWDLGIYNVAP